MKKAIFFHAGCPVCVNAEQQVIATLDQNRFDIEMAHQGEQNSSIVEAAHDEVQSAPALMLDNAIFHMNFGASLADVQGGA